MPATSCPIAIAYDSKTMWPLIGFVASIVRGSPSIAVAPSASGCSSSPRTPQNGLPQSPSPGIGVTEKTQASPSCPRANVTSAATGAGFGLGFFFLAASADPASDPTTRPIATRAASFFFIVCLLGRWIRSVRIGHRRRDLLQVPGVQASKALPRRLESDRRLGEGGRAAELEV